MYCFVLFYLQKENMHTKSLDETTIGPFAASLEDSLQKIGVCSQKGFPGSYTGNDTKKCLEVRSSNLSILKCVYKQNRYKFEIDFKF